VVRRPFASACDQDDLDFNEVFFNDVRVPAENLIGPVNEGWRVANGSLGHERNMLWLSYAGRLQELVEDFRPRSVVDRDRYATLVMDNQALRLLGSAACRPRREATRMSPPCRCSNSSGRRRRR
jgi:hypothetical protein